MDIGEYDVATHTWEYLMSCIEVIETTNRCTVLIEGCVCEIYDLDYHLGRVDEPIVSICKFAKTKQQAVFSALKEYYIGNLITID